MHLLLRVDVLTSKYSQSIALVAVLQLMKSTP